MRISHQVINVWIFAIINGAVLTTHAIRANMLHYIKGFIEA